MKRKTLLALLTAAVMAAGLVGCGNSSSSSTANSGTSSTSSSSSTDSSSSTSSSSTDLVEGAEYNFVYLSPSTESEYWQYAEVGIRNAVKDLQEEYGCTINLTVSGPASESETDAYIKAFESVIASSPDAIITATLAPDGTVPKVQEAQQAGIYVNFVSMGLEGGDSNEYGDYYGVHYYCDNTLIGETAAAAMLQAFEDRGIEPVGKIGMHMSVVVDTLEDRLDGFKAYMAENAPELECLDTLYNENDVNNAQSNVETQISTYGDELIGLYGGNNISGDGIALALGGAGLGDKIVGIAVDSDSVEIEALENGNLYAIVVQTPYEQGYNATVNAFTYLQTGENPETEKHINCDSQVVTMDNMDTEESQALLNPKILAE